jgi:aromatic-L-amino-acid decarboxylase
MNPLEIAPQEFELLCRQAVQVAVEYLESLATRAAFPATSGGDTERIFHRPWSDERLGEQALAGVREIFEHSRPPSPRFFGYVFGSGEPVAAIGDLLASIVNQNVTAWRSAPAAVAIERTVIDWLAQAVGCGGFSGSLCGGGSAANLMALAMAREAKAPANRGGGPGGMVYASEETHMSIPKAVALLGLGTANLRLVGTDACFRMLSGELERAMKEDARASRRAIAVVASAGTVSTGAIDPLAEIAEIARRHGAWVHVDGAYGALARLAIPEKFAGLDLADSLALDPHKWLYQPVDCGCLLYRDPAAARAAFAHTGEYSRVLREDPLESFAFFEESLELSRRFRALKLWFSLRYHGRAAFRAAIANDLQHAQLLAERVRQTPELELMAPVELSAVCFRYKPRGKSEEGLSRLNQAILKRVIARGQVFISNASLRGRFALRACMVNHRTTEQDIEAVVQEVVGAGREIAG